MIETYILSQRGLLSSSAYGFIFELEDLLERICGCTILVPQANQLTKWAEQQPKSYSGLLKKVIENTTGLYQHVSPDELNSKSPKHLFIICLNAARLSMLSSIPNWRQEFDTVSAFVIDAWLFGAYPKETYLLDHLFVPTLEAVEDLENKFKVPVSLLPFGADILLNGSDSLERPVDVMSFGRTPVEFHRALSNTLNHPNSHHLYYRHPELERQWHPSNTNYMGRVDREYRLLFHKMMKRAKVILAFDPLFNTDQLYGAYKVNVRPWKFQHSVLSLRWIEGCAAGCAILGKRPKTILADQILNWEDVTIELPDNPNHWIDFTKEILEDQGRLQAIHKRSYAESLARHDWRYRIQEIYETLNLPLPKMLVEELSLLSNIRASIHT